MKKLPNPQRKARNSPRLDDATVARIELHYRRLGLESGWRVDRFARLCKLLRCTARELGALCCVSEPALNTWIRHKQFPPYVSLHFALIESAYLEALRGLKRESVMPVNLLAGGS